jgi:PAS domain S-box-containing protein
LPERTEPIAAREEEPRPPVRPRGLPQGTVWRLATLVLVAVAYYVAARLSLRLALIEKNVTPLWPPTGIALVAFLLFGRRIWPGIALAAFVVNEPISTSWWAAALTAMGNTVAPFVATELLRRVGFHRELDRLRDAIALVFLGALFSMAISASVGAATLVLSDAIKAREFGSAWVVWWTGDAMGVMVVAPFLLSLLLFRRPRRGSWRRGLEGVSLVAAVTVLAFVVVRSHHPLLFTILPLLGWVAWRFQQRGAAPAALIVSAIATWGADHAWGIFQGSLFSKMLTLQGFNATVAFTSFVFAAMVTERMRDQEALARAAGELEDRVEQRTAALSASNEWLTREIAERKDAERKLRQRERQLAEAQQVGRIGSWEWLIPEDEVTWSDEMYRIHGYHPRAFPVTFDKAVELVLPEDLDGIRTNVARAFESGRDHDLPAREYRIRRMDGELRVLVGKSRLSFNPSGQPLRMVGTVQDVTEERHAEREHRIAETLQRSLLPDHVPEIPGVQLAARYIPATEDMEVGGDWYDVMQLPDGHVGVAIGDVAGHGLRAAATMGQLRMALRAYAVEEESPATVVKRVHVLAQRLLVPEMVTLVYMVFDPDASTVTFSNAGHLPPLVIGNDGEASFLEQGLAPPLGTAPHPDFYVEALAPLAAGSTLLLFTDGLVERRGVSLRQGLARLKKEAVAEQGDLDALCDRLLATLVESEKSDDIALLALRAVPLTGEPLHLRMPAEPRVLAPLRHTIRRWLRGVEASERETYEILVACGEACANAIQHPYGAREGYLEIELELRGSEIDVVVRDTGSWRPSPRRDGGRGMELMQALMDSVEFERTARGTAVRMRRRLEAKARS